MESRPATSIDVKCGVVWPCRLLCHRWCRFNTCCPRPGFYAVPFLRSGEGCAAQRLVPANTRESSPRRKSSKKKGSHYILHRNLRTRVYKNTRATNRLLTKADRDAITKSARASWSVMTHTERQMVGSLRQNHAGHSITPAHTQGKQRCCGLWGSQMSQLVVDPEVLVTHGAGTPATHRDLVERSRCDPSLFVLVPPCRAQDPLVAWGDVHGCYNKKHNVCLKHQHMDPTFAENVHRLTSVFQRWSNSVGKASIASESHMLLVKNKKFDEEAAAVLAQTQGQET